MTTREKILIVDDDEAMRALLSSLLDGEGYQTRVAVSGEAALSLLDGELPSVIVSDVNMPGMDGVEFCRRVRARFAHEILPLILITGNDPVLERVNGLQAGADDFLPKPIHREELLARIRSLAKVRALHETVRRQSSQLAAWGRELEKRVEEQVRQLGQLKRFFSPQLAELVASPLEQSLIQIHRKDVTVMFIDLRGFTAFTEKANANEVIKVLHDFYSGVGSEGLDHGATIGSFLGDGMLLFLNDPVEVPRHQVVAVQMSLSIRGKLTALQAEWNRRGHDLDFGIGIASGIETIGLIGFEQCLDYTVIGVSTNIAARLCGDAKHGQILVSEKFAKAFLASSFSLESLGQHRFKGIAHPLNVCNVLEAKIALGE